MSHTDLAFIKAYQPAKPNASQEVPAEQPVEAIAQEVTTTTSKTESKHIVHRSEKSLAGPHHHVAPASEEVFYEEEVTEETIQAEVEAVHQEEVIESPLDAKTTFEESEAIETSQEINIEEEVATVSVQTEEAILDHTECLKSPAAALLTPDETELLCGNDAQLEAAAEQFEKERHSEEATADDEDIEEVVNEEKPTSAKSAGVGRLQELSQAHRQSKVEAENKAELKLDAIEEGLLEVAEEDYSQVAELLIKNAKEGIRTVLVSGCTPQEGSTTITLTLGVALARLGCRVALVDGHFTSPGLAYRCQLENETDWIDVLQGKASLSEALVQLGSDELVVLPLNEPPEEPARWANEPRLRMTLGLLRRDYDLVLVDGGPATEARPRPIGWPQVDAALLVCDHQTTSGEHYLEAEEILRDAGVKLLGVVENFR
ncbi:Hypothetical protein PBC10988_13500 [Planctomycetales bacterium 10988]|nr:Hypothetical protein PBC10988_13500 [Planctomycetales bacterium 10988]